MTGVERSKLPDGKYVISAERCRYKLLITKKGDTITYEDGSKDSIWSTAYDDWTFTPAKLALRKGGKHS